MSRAVAVMNPKGGVGKTTTATNLAVVLAKMNETCLLIDADPDGAATYSVGIDSATTEADILGVFEGRYTPRQAIVHTQVEGLDILPSCVRTIEHTGWQLRLAADRQVLSRIVRAAKREYSWVFLDCPPSLGNMTLGALDAADSVIIPVQCSMPALNSLSKLMRLIRYVSARSNPDLDVDGLLVTMYDARTSSSPRVWSRLRESMGDLVFDTYIPHNARLNEATFHRVPAVVFAPNSPGARSYRRVALELKQRTSKPAEALADAV